MAAARLQRLSAAARRVPLAPTLRAAAERPTPAVLRAASSLRAAAASLPGPAEAAGLRPLPATQPLLRWFGRGGGRESRDRGSSRGGGGGGTGEFDLEPHKAKMASYVDALHKELRQVRASRVSPSLLDNLEVEDGEGNTLGIRSMATVTSRGPSELIVNVFELEHVKNVLKALNSSGSYGNPQAQGKVITIKFPPPSKEMREELLRSVKKKAELTRNNLRNARRNALDDLKKAGLPKDDQHREQQQVQKVTDDLIAQVDKAVEAKEKDITEG